MNMVDLDSISIPASDAWAEIREGVGRICAEFPNDYWLELDKHDR